MWFRRSSLLQSAIGNWQSEIALLNWLKYRDTEFKLIDTIYDKLQGTMYIPMRIDQKMQVLRHRALALATYIDLLTESEP